MNCHAHLSLRKMRGICHRLPWHMPQMSLAYATDIVGNCHALHWHMPRMNSKDRQSCRQLLPI